MTAVENECPIARERLIPYLSGKLDGTPEGEEFETHVSNCPVCKVIASDRRKTLQALIAALDPTKTKTFESERRASNEKSAKLLLLAGVCALLLIGISYVSGPVSAILGDKVVTGAGSEKLDSNESAPTSQRTTAYGNVPIDEESKEAIATASSTDSDKQPKQPEIKKSKKSYRVSKPKTSVEMPTRANRNASSKKKHTKDLHSIPPMNRIEIFDESGKKIGVAITPQGR